VIESDIQNAIRLYLTSIGIISFRVNVIGSYTKDGRYVPPSLPEGFSDIFSVMPNGRALFIEVKSRTGKLSLKQQNFLDRMSNHGALAFVARSVEDVKKYLGGD